MSQFYRHPDAENRNALEEESFPHNTLLCLSRQSEPSVSRSGMPWRCGRSQSSPKAFWSARNRIHAIEPVPAFPYRRP